MLSICGLSRGLIGGAAAYNRQNSPHHHILPLLTETLPLCTLTDWCMLLFLWLFLPLFDRAAVKLHPERMLLVCFCHMVRASFTTAVTLKPALWPKAWFTNVQLNHKELIIYNMLQRDEKHQKHTLLHFPLSFFTIWALVVTSSHYIFFLCCGLMAPNRELIPS